MLTIASPEDFRAVTRAVAVRFFFDAVPPGVNLGVEFAFVAADNHRALEARELRCESAVLLVVHLVPEAVD